MQPHYFTLANALRLRPPCLSLCRWRNRPRVAPWPASEEGSELGAGSWVWPPSGGMGTLPPSRAPPGSGGAAVSLMGGDSGAGSCPGTPRSPWDIACRHRPTVPQGQGCTGLHAAGQAFSAVLMVQGPCFHAPVPRQPPAVRLALPHLMDTFMPCCGVYPGLTDSGVSCLLGSLEVWSRSWGFRCHRFWRLKFTTCSGKSDTWEVTQNCCVGLPPPVTP